MPEISEKALTVHLKSFKAEVMETGLRDAVRGGGGGERVRERWMEQRIVSLLSQLEGACHKYFLSLKSIFLTDAVKCTVLEQ